MTDHHRTAAFIVIPAIATLISSMTAGCFRIVGDPEATDSSKEASTESEEANTSTCNGGVASKSTHDAPENRDKCRVALPCKYSEAPQRTEPSFAECISYCSTLDNPVFEKGCFTGGSASGPSSYIQCNCVGTLGRLPSCFQSTTFSGLDPTPTFFSSALEQEFVSIASFQILHRELSAYSAPESLLDLIKEAAADEVRHANVMRRIVHEVGGIDSARVVPTDLPTRSLEDIAIENAQEGCVRETFSALVANLQAKRISGSSRKKIFSMIARDEVQHADLAWAIDAWIRPLLSVEANARVDAALRQAVDALREDAKAPFPSELQSTAGLPSPFEMQRMVDELEARLWSSHALAA